MAMTERGLTQAADDNSRTLQLAINDMASRRGLEGCESPTTGVYHLLAMMLDYCDVYHINFDELLEEVRRDINL